MKKISFIILVCLSVFVLKAQETKKDHYSGGMLFYQPGFTFAENGFQEIKNNSNAIGGILRFYFWDYFTCGVYGGSQTTHYNSNLSENSYMTLGYGGVFAGGSFKTGKWRFTASLFAGMGGVDNLHIENQSGSTLNNAYLYHYSVITFSPIISVDFYLTSKIALTFQTICLTSRTKDKQFFYNPTVQLGVLFNR
jgi:hypothetical protein